MHKIIGIYKDFNGPEEKSMNDIIEKYNIVGQLSDFIKDIGIYYTKTNNQIIVVHDSKKYYGKDNIDTPDISHMLEYPMIDHTTVENATTVLSKRICEHLETLTEMKKLSKEDTIKLIKELMMDALYTDNTKSKKEVTQYQKGAAKTC